MTYREELERRLFPFLERMGYEELLACVKHHLRRSSMEDVENFLEDLNQFLAQR